MYAVLTDAVGKNDNLSGAKMFLEIPEVKTILAFLSVLAFIGILWQILRLFFNADNDQIARSVKHNIITIIIAYAIILTVMFIVTAVPLFFKTKRYEHVDDEDGRTHQELIDDLIYTR